MKLTRHRNRQFPRPVPFGAPVVRFAAYTVQPGERRGKAIFAGVSIEQEARLLFAEAVSQGAAGADDCPGMTLERQTFETLLRVDPGSSISYCPDPEPTTAAPSGSILSDPIAAGLSMMMSDTTATPGKPGFFTTLLNFGRLARDPISPGLSGSKVAFALVDEIPAEPRAVLSCLLNIASHHQGGHSSTGERIAETLKIPVPITMPDLAGYALKSALDPREVWPWWDSAPANSEELRAHRAKLASDID